MALRISGVSLKVEGAEQFASALGNAQRAMQKSGAELKLLEATYAGAQNSEYYQKRSEKLSAQLEAQRQRTQTLRQAREQYAATEGHTKDALDKLDVTILKSETDEQKLLNAIKACNAEMKAQANAGDQVAASTQKAGKAMRDARSDAEAWGKKLDDIAGKTTKAGSAMTRLLTLPIIGMGTMGFKYSIDFDDAMWDTATMPGFVTGSIEEQRRQLAEAGDEILAASDRTHVAAVELAAGQYQALSSGVSKADSAYWAERAAMAAKAGKSDTETVIDGASSAVNSWKETAGGLDHVLDAMIVTQNLGKTTVGEIASQIGQVSGLAPQLQITFDEIMAATAGLTANGLSTSSAITGLRGVMSAVIKPTSEAAKTAEELGLDFSAAAVRGKGLTGFLQDVMDKTQGDTEHLGKLFGQVEGLNAIMMLGTSASGLYAQALEEISHAEGTLDEAFAIRISSRSERLNGSLNRVKNAGVELTENLYPAVDMAADLLDGLAEWTGGLDESGQKALLTTLGVTAALGPATKAVGGLIKAGRTLVSLATGPMGWILGGATVAGGLLYALSAASREAEELARQRALDFDIGLNSEHVEKTVQNVQQKLDAWMSTHELTMDGTIVPKVDKEALNRDLQEAVDAAFEDKTLTVDEYVNIHTYLTDVNGEAVDGIDSGDTVISEVAAQLQGAVADYNALLDTVYRKGNTATEAEIAALDNALLRVTELRAQLLGLTMATEDVETETYRSAYNLARQGIGGQTEVEGALVYALGTGEMAVRDAEQERNAVVQARSKALREAEQSGAGSKELEDVEASYQDTFAAAEKKVAEAEVYAETLMAQLVEDMILSDAELYGYLTRGGELIQAGSELQRAYESGDDAALAAAVGSRIRSKEDLAAYGVQDKQWLDAWNMTLGQYMDDPTLGDVGLLPYTVLEGMTEQMMASVVQQMLDWAETDVPQGMENVNAVMKSAVEEGLDLSDAELPGVNDYLRVMIFGEKGLDALSDEALIAVRDAVKEIDTALEPVGNQYDVGQNAAESLRLGLLAQAGGAAAAASAMAAMVNAQLGMIGQGVNLGYPGVGLDLNSPMLTLLGGSQVNNDYSTNVTVQRANMDNPVRMRVLAEQIAVANQDKLASFGAK